MFNLRIVTTSGIIYHMDNVSRIIQICKDYCSCEIKRGEKARYWRLATDQMDGYIKEVTIYLMEGFEDVCKED